MTIPINGGGSGGRAYQNYALWSEQMATSPWFAGPGITATNDTTDVTDPHGGNTATKLVYNGSDSAGGQLIGQALGAVLTDLTLANGIWIRTASGSSGVQLTTNVGLTVVPFAIDTTWRFVEVDQVAQIDGTWVLLMFRGSADNSPRTYYVAFAQAAKMINVGPYYKTTATPVAVP